jgi:hypothetical protein
MQSADLLIDQLQIGHLLHLMTAQCTGEHWQGTRAACPTCWMQSVSLLFNGLPPAFPPHQPVAGGVGAYTSH